METLILEYRVISRSELRKKIERGDRFHLWNVLPREQHDRTQNLPRSRHVPLEAISRRTTPARKSEPLVLYSAGPVCRAARQAADRLKSLGFEDVTVYEGGLDDWRTAGLPLAAN